MSDLEFREHFKIKSLSDDQHCSATNERETVKKIKEGDTPDDWDWRMHNGVTPVKN